MRILIRLKDTKVEIPNIKKCSRFGKAWGLMFNRREAAQALLFDFKKPTRISIHSLFVFFPFLAIWVDEQGKVIDFKIIQPFKFRVKAPKPFVRLIEIPLNNKYLEVVKSMENAVGNERFKY